MNNTLLYLIVVVSSCFLQGSSFVATKVLLDTIPPLWLAAIRFFMAAISLLPLLLTRMPKTEHQQVTSEGNFFKIFLIGLFQTAAVMYFLNTGLKTAPSSTTAIIMASNPLLVTILARIFLGEPIHFTSAIGVVVSFIGVVICIGLSAGATANSGVLLVIVASTCWAVATIINKKFNLAINVWIVTFWQMLLGSIVLMIAAWVTGEKFALPDNHIDWLVLLWLAIPASTIAMGLWFKALLMEGAAKTSGFLFLCPLFSAIISYFVLGTTLSAEEFIGGVLIFVGIYAMTHRRKPAA